MNGSLAGSPPQVTVVAIPSSIRGPANATVYNVIAASNDSKGVYFLYVPNACDGVWLAVGYNPSEPPTIPSHPIFDCVVSSSVYDVKIVGVAGATVVYLPTSP